MRFPGFLCLAALLPMAVLAVDDYVLGPDSTTRGPGVPVGRVESFTFTNSQVFPETRRAGWVYIPAQYDASKPAALIVFQDGHAYVSTNGQQRVPIVLDNLIARGELPPTVAVFINPGHRGGDGPAADGWGNRNNRSFEYDSLGGAYARFLVEELLPFVTNQYQIALTSDPTQRAIAGMSSGGICAFTVAWERPDQFGCVLSQIGSFTNIRGGHVYPALIRKSERRPIRVFLQDGSNDLNNLHGNWPLANQEMASALAFAGYDFRFEYGDGAHNGKHGGVLLPDSLRWLWRPALAASAGAGSRDEQAGDAALSKVLPDGGSPEGWERITDGFGFTDAACSDYLGNLYFSDLGNNVLYRLGPGETRPVAWMKDGPKVSGHQFGPDRRIYAATQGDPKEKRIVAIDPKTRAVEVIATDVQPNDLVVSRAGFVYFTDTGAGQVVKVPITARGLSRPAPVAGGINKPNGIALSPDQRRLYVSEYGGTNGWIFRVEADGRLSGGERGLALRTPPEKPDSGGDGMTVDAAGRVWITSHLGLQVFDAEGRSLGLVPRPQDKATVSCAFAGPGQHEYLYVCSSDAVFRRRTLTQGLNALRGTPLLPAKSPGTSGEP